MVRVPSESVQPRTKMTPDVYSADAGWAKWFFFVLLSVTIPQNFAKYQPPIPAVEPLFPRGLRMSIPHEDGISLVAFHVKFNEDFEGLEAGTIARDIIKTRNGRWRYEDRTTRLKTGDVIYYWMHVVYDGLGYNLVDKQHTVTDFYNYDGSIAGVTTPDSQSCATPGTTYIYNKEGNRQNTCSGQLLFEEDFNTLDTSRWTLVERFSDAPDYEFVVYLNSNENVEVKDGSLHVKLVLVDDKHGDGYVRTGSMVLNKCTVPGNTQQCQRVGFGSYILPPVISGRLNSKGTFSFLYGRVQIRAKLPRGDWIYPLITLETTDETNTTSVFHSIRIASAPGNPLLRSPVGSDLSGCVLSAGEVTIVQNQNQHQHTNKNFLPKKQSSKPWSDDYHVYEIEWRPGNVIAKVDGEQYGQQSVPATFDKPVHLNIGLAVGGHVEFPDGSRSGNYEKPWRNVESKALFKFYEAKDSWHPTWTQSDTSLHVDYVKVWAL